MIQDVRDEEQNDHAASDGNAYDARREPLWRRIIAWVLAHRVQSSILGGGGLLVMVLGVVLPGEAGPGEPIPIPPRAVEGLVLRPREQVVDSFEITGKVENNRVVRVAAEVAARVDAYAGRDDRFEDGQLVETNAPPLEEGDVVREGQPILLLNKDLLKAARDAAQAEFEFLTDDVRRIKESYEQGVATTLEVDQILMKYKVAKANLARAQANLDRACVRAPIDGVLNRLPVEIGEYVQPGMVAAEIVDADPAVVVVSVPEKDIRFFGIGERQTILHGPAGKETLDGRITYISATADPLTLTTRVELTVPNPETNGTRRLRDSDIVRVRMVRRILRNPLMIPVRAVIPLERGYVAYVAVEGKAERRRIHLDQRMLQNEVVRLLPPTAEQTALAEADGETAGLAAGETLILQPARVGPGQPVDIVDLQGKPGPLNGDDAADADTPTEQAAPEASQPEQAP
ncbi:MAG: efflux RND transporter periplasmic adaptor subunit [Planctomycetes bacterium]|jgi:RND family efflux transporter MFP subunit|nr:efflux RND transporter periplasmic adaptor subunit [Phycisphaerae bacterium]NBB94489.1 efflux RND transporter periplasmic adaptor subunit [Planctomycetota bacterium]